MYLGKAVELNSAVESWGRKADLILVCVLVHYADCVIDQWMNNDEFLSFSYDAIVKAPRVS